MEMVDTFTSINIHPRNDKLNVWVLKCNFLARKVDNLTTHQRLPTHVHS